MAEEWINDFEAFFRHIGPCPDPAWSLDRIDPNGNYVPGNVRWAPPEVQARNKTNNRWIKAGGEELVLAEWAERLGVSPTKISRELDKGQTMEAIIQKFTSAGTDQKFPPAVVPLQAEI